LHFRTRTLLTGAALTLLALVFAAGLGASNAAAASAKAPPVHKISACGYVATAPGMYELTKSIADVGSGDCIVLKGNNQTLNLMGHTITGTGSDTCILVSGSGSSNYYETVNQTVVGGVKNQMATLKDCEYGLYVEYNSGTKASNLNMVSPTSEGVYTYWATGAMLTNINVALHANTAYGFYLEEGGANVVTHCTVDNNSTDASFYAYYEIGDTFSYDTAKDSYHKSGNSGTGFYDYESTRDTFTHDTSNGNSYGFYLYDDSYGTVTATYNTATDPNSVEYGFYVYGAYQEADYASPYHTLIAHNTTNGFEYGYYDDSSSSYAVAEKWLNNTADNYSEYGFYIYYTTNYTMNGNVADMNTKTKKYDGSSTSYGFYLYDPYSYYPFKSFDNNQAYDSEYGFYSDEYAVPGKGNIAKRNLYSSYGIQLG